MTSNQIAIAIGSADETEKVMFAHFIADRLKDAGMALDDAGVRQIVAACDRYAADHGTE